jgi:Secretion system C-terminal sorting domain
MKKSLQSVSVCLFLFCFLFTSKLYSQTIMLSGACITGTITLAQGAAANGKVTYEGVGTVAGISGVAVSIVWFPASDNLWVIQFSGQPFVTNVNNTVLPTPTPSGVWANQDVGTCPNTTPLSLTGTGALPVELTAFNAQMNKNTVDLAWRTESESNNRGFEILRSSDGNVWQNMGFVKGHGSTITPQNYQFIDNNPHFGNGYYQLKQIDFNDAAVLSKIVHVTNEKSVKYQISPNPTKDIFLVSTSKIDESTPLSISVFDMAGKRILSKLSLSNQVEIDLTAFSIGAYIVEMRYDNQIFHKKMIKQ